MSKSKYLSSFAVILVASLFILVSCSSNQESPEILERKNSSALSVTDSLLSIVDSEFEIIKHEGEEHEIVFNQLLDRLDYYKIQILQKDTQIIGMEENIDILKSELIRADSSIKKLEWWINDISVKLSSAESSLRWEKIRNKEERAMYDAMVYRFEDSLLVLNDSIQRMELFIRQNVRSSKLKELQIEQ